MKEQTFIQTSQGVTPAASHAQVKKAVAPKRIWDTTQGEPRSYFDAEPIARLLLHEKRFKHVKKEMERTQNANAEATKKVDEEAKTRIPLTVLKLGD